MTGYKHTKETKKRLSIIRKNLYKNGLKHPSLGNKRPDLAEYNKNVKSDEMKGDKNPNWRGGTTDQRRLIMSSREYKLWRKSVFERDNYTCIWCGRKDEVSGHLEADHIKPFCDYPELRFAIDNGRTLCHECHTKTDTYLVKGRWNKQNDS